MQRSLIKTVHLRIASLLVAMLSFIVSAQAQSAADTIRKEIAAINAVYDSAYYLSFDIHMQYISDTLYGGTDSADYEHTSMDGSYTFHRNNALYNLGDITFLQNDSYTIAVYRENKFILVGKPSSGKRSGSFMPNRALIDSMAIRLTQEYTYSYWANDSTGFIQLNAIDSNNVYESIVINYEPVSHRLRTINYRFRDNGGIPASTTAGIVNRKATMIFDFRNYRIQEIGNDVFSEGKFITFDGPGNMQPAQPFRDYTIYKNN